MVPIIYLGQWSLIASINLPSDNGRATLRSRYIWFFSSWGLPMRLISLSNRWSLTPPFHPYL